MEQDIRKRMLTIVGIAAGVLLALFLFIAVIRDDDKKEEIGEPRESQADQADQAPGTAPRPAASRRPVAEPLSTQEPEDVYLKQLSRIFVERFGSYSNQNDNRHITDVLPIITARMQSYVEDQGLSFSGEYSGVTTKVIASSIEKKGGSEATVRVDVQRVILAGGPSKTEYQSGVVTLRRAGEEWKIDALYWNK